MLKGLNQGIKILIFSCLASLTAFAQAEIAPDHCDDQSSSASAVAKPSMAAQISAAENFVRYFHSP